MSSVIAAPGSLAFAVGAHAGLVAVDEVTGKLLAVDATTGAAALFAFGLAGPGMARRRVV